MNGDVILHRVWLRAALLGSTWASIEIVLGSFLHNIRFPVTGTILAAIGSALLVAGSGIWDDKGLLWRAGLICALMKSISPSAVIFGPMIGIVVEALLLQGSVSLFGRNLAGYLVGSALAGSMPMLQKIVGVLLAFGPDAARLYAALYDFAARSLHITAFGPLDLILLLIAINIVFGIFAGMLGVLVGREALRQPQPVTRPAPSELALFARVDPSQKFSLLLLLVNAMAMAGGFAAIQWLPLWASSVCIILYLLLCTTLYAQARKQFRRLRLWAEFSLVSLLAGLLLGGLAGNGVVWSWAGLKTGAEMTLRATLVIASFTTISTEFRNPVIVSWLLRQGLGHLSAALAVAFQALPAMTVAFGEEKRFLHHPIRSIARVLSAGYWWLNKYEQHGVNKPPVFIITGHQGSGKTSFASALIELLRHHKWKVGGILAPVVQQNGTREGYDILNILTSQRTSFCRAGVAPTGIASGPFHFLPEGIAFGKAALNLLVIRNCDCLCIDEIGPLEMEGNGWADATGVILQQFQKPVILVVRTSLVDTILRRWSIRPHHTWHAGDTEPAAAIETLLHCHR